MQIFTSNDDNFISRHRKIHDNISLVLTLLILPLFSWLIVTLGEKHGGNRAVFNSLSSLAYVDGQLGWVLAWGMLTVGAYVYLFILNVYDSGLSKYFRLFFIICSIIAFSLLTTSSLIPYSPDATGKAGVLNKFHNGFAHWGFGFIVVNLALYVIILLFRSLKQFKFTTLFYAFTLIVSLFMVFEANEKEYSPCDISSIAQVMVFLTFNAYLTICYFTNRLFSLNSILKPKVK